MASRSPAIFLLLALPLLCYVVSIEAHTLPDNIVPDSRGLSEEVVPEFSLEARATKGLKDEVNEFIEARATKGLKDEVNEFIEAVKTCDAEHKSCPATIEDAKSCVNSGGLGADCHECAVCIAEMLKITLPDLISKVSTDLTLPDLPDLTKALNDGLLQSKAATKWRTSCSCVGSCKPSRRLQGSSRRRKKRKCCRSSYCPVETWSPTPAPSAAPTDSEETKKRIETLKKRRDEERKLWRSKAKARRLAKKQAVCRDGKPCRPVMAGGRRLVGMRNLPSCARC